MPEANSDNIDPALFRPLACFRFVKLVGMDSVHVGPLHFWKGSCSSIFLPEVLRHDFTSYLGHFGTIRATDDDSGKLFVTKRFSPEEMTVCSVNPRFLAYVHPHQADELIEDGSYLLYFVSGFRDFDGGRPRPCNAFLSRIIATPEILSERAKWSDQFSFERQREDQFRLASIEPKVTNALGRLLTAKYTSINPGRAQRVIRAIRYFCDRFFDRTRGPITEMPSLPEDIVFLCSAFEALFNLHEGSDTKDQLGSKLTNRLQAVLGLKHEKPRAIAELWVKEFYNLRSALVHGGDPTGLIFHGNSNLEISYVRLAVKIFLLAVYHELAGFGVLDMTIAPNLLKDEISLLFWPIEDLLKEIKKAATQLPRCRNASETAPQVFELEELTASYSVFFAQQSRLHTLRAEFTPPSGKSVLPLLKAIQAAMEAEIQTEDSRKKIKEFHSFDINGKTYFQNFLALVAKQIEVIESGNQELWHLEAA